MTNTIAIWLAALILAFFVADAYLLHLDAHIVLMKTLADLIGWLAFWR
ncbi:hypothetical protein AB3Y40_08730 [Yoonia sp. R2331]